MEILFIRIFFDVITSERTHQPSPWIEMLRVLIQKWIQMHWLIMEKNIATSWNYIT